MQNMESSLIHSDSVGAGHVLHAAIVPESSPITKNLARSGYQEQREVVPHTQVNLIRY
jgi:hypothetical protein